MKELPLSEVDRCWGPPERVALITSVDATGKPNIIAVGWIMRANMSPPVYAIGLGMKSHSCQNISAQKEFALMIPGTELARQVMYCGTHTGAEVDKFAETGLTAVPASQVAPPLIGECLAGMECKVIAVQDIQDHRVFFGEVVAGWTSEKAGKSLLTVGENSGYEQVYQEGAFRLGAVRD